MVGGSPPQLSIEIIFSPLFYMRFQITELKNHPPIKVKFEMQTNYRISNIVLMLEGCFKYGSRVVIMEI